MASSSNGDLAQACTDRVGFSADGVRRARMVPQIAPATPTMQAAIQLTISTVMLPPHTELSVESLAMKSAPSGTKTTIGTPMNLEESPLLTTTFPGEATFAESPPGQ